MLTKVLTFGNVEFGAQGIFSPVSLQSSAQHNFAVEKVTQLTFASDPKMLHTTILYRTTRHSHTSKTQQ